MVTHRTVQVAGVDAFTDHGQAPAAEGDVVADASHVATGAAGVSFDEVGVGGESAGGSRVVGAGRRCVAVVPVDAEVADVGKRVAQRAQLPVEHRVDPATTDIGQAVAEAVVAVGDRHALLHGEAVAQPAGDLVDGPELAGLGLLPLRRPPLDLPLDVTVALGEIAEPDLVDVDGMKVGQHIDEMLADPRAQRERQFSGPLGTVEHDAVDKPHHVEGRAVDAIVGAQPEGRRHRHVGAPNRRDDAMLAGHVVSRGQHAAQWWAPQHVAMSVGIGDRVGEVGTTAGDQRESERTSGVGNVRLEPLTDPIDIDARHKATP